MSDSRSFLSPRSVTPSLHPTCSAPCRNLRGHTTALRRPLTSSFRKPLRRSRPGFKQHSPTSPRSATCR
eukprot:821709-Pleurochrysis_carterae.AAC.1